eukprot:6852864-Pyramimonas_sp.AAC.1
MGMKTVGLTQERKLDGRLKKSSQRDRTQEDTVRTRQPDIFGVLQLWQQTAFGQRLSSST